jgi:hypothetical protein
MGEHTETIAAGVGGKDNHPRSSEAYHVGVSPQEDRRSSKSTLGEGQGAAEEGGITYICQSGWLLPRSGDSRVALRSFA